MAETIGKLALRIADGMPDCCNDQNGWGRTYEFEPQELEAFARALQEQAVLEGGKQVPVGPTQEQAGLAPSFKKLREALEIEAEQAKESLTEFDRQFNRHPSTEDNRQVIVEWLEQINLQLDVLGRYVADRKDAERLDWLDRNFNLLEGGIPYGSNIRETIDDAMAAQGSACHG